MKSPMRCGIRLLVGQRPSRADYVRDLWLPTDSRRGAGGHPAGDRRRSVLMLPPLHDGRGVIRAVPSGEDTGSDREWL